MLSDIFYWFLFLALCDMIHIINTIYNNIIQLNDFLITPTNNHLIDVVLHC